MAKTEYLEDRRKRRWFAGGQAYIIFMVSMLAVMFVYEEQQREHDQKFVERVCKGLEQYRQDSNERREYVQTILQQAIEKREKEGPPLTAEEKKQAENYLKAFSAIPPVDDCQP